MWDDFVIEQGATLDLAMTWYGDEAKTIIRDLTGWLGRMQVRRSKSDTVKALDLTTANGGVVLAATAPNIRLFATDEATEAIEIKKGVYDLELEEPSGKVWRVLEGKCLISKDVTR